MLMSKRQDSDGKAMHMCDNALVRHENEER